MLRIKALHSRSTVRQKGIVLIMALLIVAMVTTVVVSVTWRFNLSVARNMNRWHGAQARVFLEAAEQAALQGLRLDAQLGPTDSLLEQWAQPAQLPTPVGMVSGHLEDAQGRLNLNLMVADKQDPKKPKSRLELLSSTQLMFIRFLQTIELEEGLIDLNTAMDITDAIEDWIDSDDLQTGAGGAESSYYMGLDPPIAITDNEMATVSELALVKGVTPELFKKLEPFVIALPGYKHNEAAIKPNINTLKPELLRCLNNKGRLEPLDEATFAMLKTVRDSANAEFLEQMRSPGFQSVNEFLNNPELASLWLDPKPYTDKDLVVGSNYFLLFAQASIEDQTAGGGADGGIMRRAKSILWRPTPGQENGQIPRVVRRTDANF